MADEKDPAAEYDLAYCYEKGIGVEIDLKEAYALYYSAAVGTQDSRLKMVATAAANVVKAHLAASRATLAITR
jgi:TPR repeat protein